MNFNTLEIKDTYKHSGAKKAVIYSANAEYGGSNFKAVTMEKHGREKNEVKYNESHVKSMD